MAVAVGDVTYPIWTMARDIGANLTKIAYGDVEISGRKPPQVVQGGNTFIEWSAIPGITPRALSGGGFNFTTANGSAQSQASSTTSPVLDLTAPNISSYVYAKTNIGGWFFDAVINLTHTSQLTITSHPVQTGNNVTDYAFLLPRTLSMNVGMSDTATSFIPGQFAGGSSRSVEAYKVLEQLQQLRIPIQVYTRLGLYQNMLIQQLTVPDDYTTHNGLKCTVDLQELLVTTVQTVKISSAPSTTSSAKQGTKQPQQVQPSLLKMLTNVINGTSG